MGTTLRRAVPTEGPALTALALAGKRHWGYPEFWLEIWREQLTITPEYLAAHVVFCATDETGQIVGFYALERDGSHLRLEHLWLQPSSIGCGLGRHLFEHAVQAAQALGVAELLIEADPNAEGFYRHLGAQRIGEIVSHLTGEERILPLLRYTLPGSILTGPAIVLTGAQETALRRLVSILDQSAACYQFTGGFAGNLHGSRWPLHDLDVDVAQRDLPRVAELLQRYTTRPLGLYGDAEFELHLWRGEIEGIPIDISQAEDAYARVGGQRIPLGTSLANRQRVRVLDLEVWVQPLAELIAYKELLGRSADLADLRHLVGLPEVPREA